MLTQLRRDLRKTVPYVLAAALLLATLWIRQVLIHAPDDKTFIIFTAPVFLTAYIWGLGPGVVATVLGALCMDYYVLAPKGSLTIESPLDLLNLIIFASVCLAVSVAGEQLHRTRRDAEASRLLTGSLAHAAEHDSWSAEPPAPNHAPQARDRLDRAERRYRCRALSGSRQLQRRQRCFRSCGG